MKLSKIMFAVTALSVGAAAFAAPNAARVAISSGASASKGNLKNALTNLCTAASGTLTEFTSGSNISTYVCANGAVSAGAGGTYVSKGNTEFIDFSGTQFAEVRLNVSGGSFSSVCLVQKWAPLGFPQGTAGTPVNTGTSCDTINANGSADRYFDPAANALAVPSSSNKVVGGLSDVEPTAWPDAVTNGLTPLPQALNAGIAQSFGVAVTDLLYNAMFQDQWAGASLDTATGTFIANPATFSKPIPGDCATFNVTTGAFSAVASYTRPVCIPSISKGRMATVMANNEFNQAYAHGAQYLASQLADGTLLEYNRRADTSGTQASAQAYFLGLPCTGSNALSIVPAPAVGGSTTIGAITVFAHSGTGDVRTRLNTAGVYGIGIMSGENNQTDTGTSWKWLRVQGEPIGESAKPVTGVTNRASVTRGTYDFYFESKVVPGSAVPTASYWDSVLVALGSLAAPVGLLNTSDLTGAGTVAAPGFNKAGQACQYNSSN